MPAPMLGLGGRIVVAARAQRGRCSRSDHDGTVVADDDLAEARLEGDALTYTGGGGRMRFIAVIKDRAMSDVRLSFEPLS